MRAMQGFYYLSNARKSKRFSLKADHNKSDSDNGVEVLVLDPRRLEISIKDGMDTSLPSGLTCQL